MQGKTTYITIDGVTKTMNDWCAQYGVNPQTVRNRIKRGADPLTAMMVKEWRPEPRPKGKKKVNQKDVCMRCKYRNFLNHAHTKGQVYCEYMFHEGHRRPCPADGCTVMVPGPMLQVRPKPFVTHERGWEGNG